jgi:hypothetical protein
MADRAHVIEVRVDIKAITMMPDHVLVNYEIPYGGMVEVRIYNALGRMVWRNQYIQRNGPNEVKIRSNRLPAGTYNMRFTYKGLDTEHPFTLSQEGRTPPSNRNNTPPEEPETPTETDPSENW